MKKKRRNEINFLSKLIRKKKRNISQIDIIWNLKQVVQIRSKKSGIKKGNGEKIGENRGKRLPFGFGKTEKKSCGLKIELENLFR